MSPGKAFETYSGPRLLGFVLVAEDGRYVQPPGKEKSYSSALADARVYRRLAAAEADRCKDSERVGRLEEDNGSLVVVVTPA